MYHSSQNDLILDTKVRGNPRPVISWTKDQIPVVLDDRVVQIEHLDGICELIVNKPTINDNGVYVCTAQNKLGSQSTTHTVVVDTTQLSRRSSVLSAMQGEEGAAAAGGEGGKKPKKLPKKDDEAEGGGEGGYERRSRMPDPSPKQMLYFTVNISNRYVAEGSKVKLQAVIGGPDPTIKWQKDEQNVQYGPRIRNMNRDGLAVLEFTSALPEDSGTYSILAQNEFCKITTSAVLHVYQPKVNTDVQPVFIRSLKGNLVVHEVVPLDFPKCARVPAAVPPVVPLSLFLLCSSLCCYPYLLQYPLVYSLSLSLFLFNSSLYSLSYPLQYPLVYLLPYLSLLLPRSSLCSFPYLLQYPLVYPLPYLSPFTLLYPPQYPQVYPLPYLALSLSS